jgi:hypothetical protein
MYRRLGFSRYFTAVVVEGWREKFPDNHPIIVEDLLEPADPVLRYNTIRAAGAAISKYEQHTYRLTARVEKWLAYFADTRRALPTHDGRDNAYLVRTPAGYLLVESLQDIAA